MPSRFLCREKRNTDLRIDFRFAILSDAYNKFNENRGVKKWLTRQKNGIAISGM